MLCGYLGLGSIDGSAAVCSAFFRFSIDNPAERITFNLNIKSLANAAVPPGLAFFVTDSPSEYKNTVTKENADATAEIYSPGTVSVEIIRELDAGSHWLCVVPYKAGLCIVTAADNTIIPWYTYIGIIKNAFANRTDGNGNLSDTGNRLRIYADVSWSDGVSHEYNLTYEIAQGGQGYSVPHTLYAGVITDPEVNIDPGKSYKIRITLTYLGNKKRQTEITVPSAGYTLFLKAGGKGVAFGKAAELDNTLELAKGWALKLGDVTVTEEDLLRLL